MTNNISTELLAQLYGQTSGDPLLMLVTLTHTSFTTIRLVNNIEDITSRSQTYMAFPMMIRLPSDDGESTREADIEFDNVSRELIDEMRTVTTPISIKFELVLASNPDYVQMTIDDLKLRGITYDQQRIKAKLFLDNFLNVELTSEKYTPTIFPGLF